MLELPVLGLLKGRSMHGYELRKQLGTMLGPLWQVSWGSLYPTLRRLARAGAVEKVSDNGGGAKGRRRTVYRITPAGEDLFTRLLEETRPPVDAEHFTVKLAFFRYLEPETRLALLERRRAYLLDKLAQFKANLRDYRERMDRYALSLQSHDMATTQSDLAWIDELITDERDATALSPSVRRQTKEA
jgi:DNA-binding PadR family transcriptional regulator